jgi:DNA-binding transcriptional LysR family regulator
MFGGLNLRQLDAFYWVVQLGSFSGAALRLSTTQPAISTRLRELENRLGTPVFDRARRGVRLNPKGRELLGLVEQLRALDRDWETRLGDSASVGGLIRLGAADTMAMTLIPPLLARLRDRHPNLEVELLVDLSVNLHARLREGEIDVAFVAGELGSPEYASRALGAVENTWAASPRLRLGGRTIGTADLAGHAVFTHSRGSHLHRMVSDWFQAAGVHPKRLHGCNSLAMMIKLTVAGLGVSVLPVPLIRGEVARRELSRLRLDRPVPPNRFFVTWPSVASHSAVRAIVDLASTLASASEGLTSASGGRKPAIANAAMLEAAGPGRPRRAGGAGE